MKKTLVSVLIAIILSNLIFSNCYYVSALSAESFDQMMNEGTVDNGSGESVSVETSGNSVIGTVVGCLASFFNIVPIIAQAIMSTTINEGGIITKSNESGFKYYETVTIKNIVTGRYFLLDANVFRKSSNLNLTGNVTNNLPNVLDDLRGNIGAWFIIVRDIAIAINLGMLIYVSIRMVIATVASEKAKYKELIYNWVVSMIIVFLIQYILIAINLFSQMLVDVSAMVIEGMENNGRHSFEDSIINVVMLAIIDNGGYRLAMYSILYWIVVWTQIKFILIYVRRMLTSFFLTIISPLITVTYAADKIDDKKAQAFGNWLKEYSHNILIQPIHCFIYGVFMFMANNIATEAPLVGLIFLLSLPKAEKIVMKIISVTADASMNNEGKKLSMKGMGKTLKPMMPGGKK